MPAKDSPRTTMELLLSGWRNIKGWIAVGFRTWLVALPAVVLLAILVVVSSISLWIDRPIFVEAFTVDTSADKSGLTATALADHLKAQISQINSASGDLFEVRKLSDSGTPLDVKIGSSGLSTVSISKSLGMRFTTAEIAGRISHIGNSLVLQFTMSQGVPVRVEVHTIQLPAAQASDSERQFLYRIDRALDCFATNVIIAISPDVAANYLHTIEKKDSPPTAADTEAADCTHPDDVDLYSQVVKNGDAPPAARVNALVGLSVHYSEMREPLEEVNMAEAATILAARLMPCEDRPLLSLWQGFTCAIGRKRSPKNMRAHIAAWMQLGAAYSDSSAVALTQNQVLDFRKHAIDAYQHLVNSTPRYALAYEALGEQQAMLLREPVAIDSFKNSLHQAETAAAYVDRGLALIHGRRDSFVRLGLNNSRGLKEAEDDFRRAIQLDPDYWDAHTRLGYVLFEEDEFRGASDVLGAALIHDSSNRLLRRFLASIYADMCQFEKARSLYKGAYRAEAANAKTGAAVIDQKSDESAYVLDTLTDWGKVLDGFGFRDAALEQETEVLRRNPKSILALVYRGQIAIKHRSTDPNLMQQGFYNLSAALAYDVGKSPFVLEAYLKGLTQRGQASEAIALYKSWASLGLVPPPINSTSEGTLDSAPNQRLRVTYAEALDANNQKKEAEAEKSFLVMMGMRREFEIADISAQSRGIVGDEDALELGTQRPCETSLMNQTSKLQDVSIDGR